MNGGFTGRMGSERKTLSVTNEWLGYRIAM